MKDRKPNELFFVGDDNYSNLVSGDYITSKNQYVTFIFMYRYRRGTKVSDSYFEVFLGSNMNDIYEVVEWSDLKNFKERIERVFKIDVLLS